MTARVCDTITEKFDQLFQRALSDDGPEGTVALNLLVQMARKHEGRVFFIPTDPEIASPYYALVTGLEGEIAELKAQLADVSKHAERLQRSMTRLIEVAAPSPRAS